MNKLACTLRRSAPLLFPLLLLAASGCDDSTGPASALDGGVLATFKVEGETLRLWTTNATTIQDLYALLDGTSQADIPNGPLLEGPGRGDHNDPWSWHLDPEATTMAEVTIEVCSAVPSHVEENLEDFMQLGQYCPWSAVLLKLEDFR